MRPPPKTLPPEIPKVAQMDKKLIVQERRYELITPLYGGGVEAGKVDRELPIRGTSIRGQLRFWWRACHVGNFSSLSEMKKAEDKLWGRMGDEQKDKDEPPQSKVFVAVKTLKGGKANSPFEVIHKQKYGKLEYYNGQPVPQTKPKENVAPAYASFPLRPEEKTQKIGMETTPVVEGISFTLKISFPRDEKLKLQVEATLWAWETFGGIGARTRRGFGALRLVSKEENGSPLPISLPEADKIKAEDFIKNRLKEHVKIKSSKSHGNIIEDVPKLIKGLKFKIIEGDAYKNTKFANAFEAWKYLIEQLKQFRQKRTRTDIKDSGRSKWPEPDNIRNWTEQHIEEHKPEFDREKFNFFPRAAFGLPIIFEFADRDKKNPSTTDADPITTTLTLSNSDRLASPLILRPLACKDNKTVGLAIILEGTQRLIKDKEKNLVLKSDNGTQYKNFTAKLEPEEADKVWKYQRRDFLLKKQTDVLKAFLDWLARDRTHYPH